MKENSHIFFAKSLIKKIKKEEIKKIISSNLGYYYLGSVFPDIFFHRKDSLKLADFLHGKNGEKTNELIFDFLDLVKKEESKKDLAFIFGYLTHATLDITFHPVIYYLTGNYYDENEEKRIKAQENHRALETLWDKKLNKKDLIKKEIKIKYLNSLNIKKFFLRKFDLSEKRLEKIFKNFKLNNRLFRNRFVFSLLSFLVKIGLYKRKEDLKFFYHTKNGNIEKQKEEFFIFRDLITGEKKNKKFDELLFDAEKYSLLLIKTAFLYSENLITKEKAEENIKGESFDTGKNNYSVKDILYTKKEEGI